MKALIEVFFKNVPRYISLLALLVVPIFAMPIIPIGFLYTKIGLLLLLVSVGFILYITKSIYQKELYIPSVAYTLAVKILVVSGILSAYFSVIPELSFMGSGVELHTLFMLVLISVLGYLVGVYIKDRESILVSAKFFVIVSFAVAVFHVLRFLFGSSFLSFGFFKSFSANTVGSLADLSLYASVALLITVFLAETIDYGKIFKRTLYIGGALLTCLIVVTNFSAVTGLTASRFNISMSVITALFLLIIGWYTYRNSKKVPYFSGILAALLIIAGIWSTQISTFTIKHTGMTPQETLDIRVSPSASVEVIKGVYSENAKSVLLGSGQGTYFSLWAKYKNTNFPNSVNITPFWNYDFNSGFSHLVTVLATTGIFGLISWLFLFGLVLYAIVKNFKEDEPWRLVFGIPAAYLLLVFCLYTPGVSMLVLMFACIGIVLAQFESSKNRGKLFGSLTMHFQYKKTAVVLLMNTMLMFSVVALLFVAGNWSLKAVASYRADKGLFFAQMKEGNLAEAERFVSSAVSINPANTYLRFLSELTLLKPGQLVTQKGAATFSKEEIEEAGLSLTRSIQAAETAALSKGLSNDYRDWIQLGKAYEVATFLGSKTTAPLTIQAYARAETLAPKNPIPPYLVARIFFYANQDKEALQKVRESLTLKPDYEPGLSLFKVLTSTSTTSTVVSSSTVQNKKIKSR